MTRAHHDPRGQVAIVYASDDGPAVDFIDRVRATSWGAALAASMRAALAVYACRDGTPARSWPRAIWIQPHAGAWELA